MADERYYKDEQADERLNEEEQAQENYEEGYEEQEEYADDTELDKLLDMTLKAMAACEDTINAEIA